MLPTLKGGYSLPYVFKESESMLGYIPIAPATSNLYGPSQYSLITVPTLFIYGSKDKNLGKRGSQSFSYVPNIEIYEIENGSHSCYIDYPDVFNNKIKEFILAQTESCRVKQQQELSQLEIAPEEQNVAQNQTLT